ncbi:hypothetical protein [Streptomyces sp. NBC_01465]|uniref:hypothetical protein n=1 Tax=Streptomyces sp. NBC_01465 TaxID=2903878 RepID=UPI002E365849|nr:hypothetical protein [Streptomyces sp. NBC_01465]
MPAARLHKDGAYETRNPYQVHAGQDLAQLLGYVTPFAAVAPDRTEIGTVRNREGGLRKDTWTVTQHGLATFDGTPDGANSKLRHASPLRLIPFRELGDNLLSFRLRFRAPQSQGFTVTRRAGVRATYEAKIDDPRVSRLLVLACIVQLNNDTVDPRKTAVDFTANPFKG